MFKKIKMFILRIIIDHLERRKGGKVRELTKKVIISFEKIERVLSRTMTKKFIIV